MPDADATPHPEPRDTDIAVIGMAARFPDAADLDAFRANLAGGRDSVGPMPPDRIAATGIDPSVTYLPMGHLHDIEQFDHRFFDLSRREASVIDPQQRIALLLAYQAIEDAGYATGTLADRDTAVILSASQSSYHAPAVDPGPLSLLGNAGFAGAARIAHLLGLTGPCYSVDSGCNSALVAVHRACRELSTGDAEYALAGGVSVRVHGTPDWGGGSFTEIVSPSGRCRAFDADADGTVGGEGGAVLLLTTVARARADRATVYAVIRGSATRHNGHAAATISTPSAAAQAKVIAKAWADAGLSPAAAGYLETHGSGTRLGDAVELEGITRAFAGAAALPIGSVKTNIGHLDHASGIAGLVKAVLSVANAQLYPSLHFTRATGGMDLAAAGLEVLTEARAWTGDRERLAGVSAFSLGGSVAHCVVSQAPDALSRARQHTVASAPEGDTSHPSRLAVVSARSAQALRAVCTALAEALRDPAAPPIDDIARTLALGRTHHEYRIALTATSTPELARALASAPLPESPVGRPPKVVLLLSPDAVPEVGRAAALPPQLPATGRVAEVLAGQLAAHNLLRDCGIEFAAILSAGSSRYLSRYLLGSPDTATADELAAPAVVDGERLAHAAATLLSDGPVVFVEPSPHGRLGTLLAELVPEADTCTGGTPLDLLGGLYQRGIDLDWQVIAPADAHRVRLPGHPMHPTRCWVDLPAQVPTPQLPTAGSAVTAADPADPVQWLRTTLRELLHSDDEIDADADYFEIGGNSIIAVQLVDRVEESYGFRPKLLDVYEHPTLTEFAQLLSGSRTRTEQPVFREPVPALVAHDEPVMSSGQERMWFHHQLDPMTTLYNYPVVQLLRGPIDIDALHGTFEDLADRHETLRYNFAEQDGVPVLRIRPRLGEFFRRVDLSGDPDATATARELVREHARARFDLGADPLVRVLVVTLGPDLHVLQLTCHHAVTDGATPTILARELPELYAARREGRPHRLAPLPIRYRDYAAWHRKLMAGSALDHELAYWTEVLADAPVLHLPTDFPRPARKTFVGDLYPFVMPGELTTRLRALGQRHAVSLFVVLLTGLYLTLARHSGQRDIVIGTPTTGRGRREFEDLIGYFNSTVALRTDFSRDRELPQLLERVRSVVLGALEHQEIPFDRVVNALVEQRDLSRTPLFDVLYIHQVTPRLGRVDGAAPELFDIEHSAGNEFGGLPTGTAKFDLTLVTYEYTDGVDQDMGACLEFSTELFTRQSMARIAQDLLAILTAMADGAPSVAELVGGAQAPATLVPTDRPRPASRAYTLEVCSETVIGEFGERAEGLGPGADPTSTATAGIHADVLAAWTVLLAWYTGDDRIRLGLSAHAADDPHSVIVELTDDTTWAELREQTRRLMDPLLPADPAAHDDGASTDHPSQPTSAGQEAHARPAEPVHYVFGANSAAPPPPATTELAVSWTATSPGTLTLHLQYATELFEPDSARTMLGELRRLLTALPARPSDPVHDTAAAAIDEELEMSR
ncbi:polyketide synthase [Nocardia cyriacigeorgica]|uniref:condensation domain-containing protein n=1 Tax=Nocardia cyriacigeorgica TaxID=135487 RepID=UPI00189346A3|nr:condensation domain-containing protein [Nocardia cyriacigeorgica]MBF6318711.1 polyketide synthase [Nocardia cyriacigeorgica]MBF6531778.1 polyketide synthase [Nocardia cyriacigeorgica]